MDEAVDPQVQRTGAGAGLTERLPPARLRGLRHVHATTLLAGVPVHLVAARLGHADPSVALRVYAHVVRERIVAVAHAFAEAVRESCEQER
ncbi:tyrosine-type recombinase/integrase [Thermobifida fusca]|uniref:tyrosine-type recombinase/integrase n=1 Tax=Thermobifida fusca TaxID=2021 RepID=UPI0009EDEDE7